MGIFNRNKQLPAVMVKDVPDLAPEKPQAGALRSAMMGVSRSIMNGWNALRVTSPYEATSARSDLPSPGNPSTSMLAMHALKTIALARYAYRNDGILRHAWNFLTQSVVGTGPVPRFLHEELRQHWKDWTKIADWNGDLSYGALLAAGYMDQEVAGDVFIRLVEVEFDGRTVPLRLQLIPAEMIPHDLCRPLADDGTVVENGIVYYQGRRVGYMVYNRHPNSVGNTTPLKLEFVSSDDMIHMFRPLQTGSQRGETRAIAALKLAFRLHNYVDNEMKRKAITTLFAGFIRDLAQTGNGEAAILPYQTEGTDGSLSLEWEGGSLIEIPPGKDITFPNIIDTSGAAQVFIKYLSLAQAAAMDLPYEQMMGDWKDTSDRTGQLQSMFFDQFVDAERERLTHQACSKIEARFVQLASEWGVWTAPKGVEDHKHAQAVEAWPSRNYKHPLQDIKAKKEAIDNIAISRDAVIAENGDDPRESDLSAARSMARLMLLGIKPDTMSTFTPTPLSARLVELERLELDALIVAMERSDPRGSTTDPKRIAP